MFIPNTKTVAKDDIAAVFFFVTTAKNQFWNYFSR
jgi:hypothetical protein